MFDDMKYILFVVLARLTIEGKKAIYEATVLGNEDIDKLINRILAANIVSDNCNTSPFSTITNISFIYSNEEDDKRFSVEGSNIFFDRYHLRDDSGVIERMASKSLEKPQIIKMSADEYLNWYVPVN